MPSPFDDVRPGDVISSSLMNFILDKLSEIDDRVTDLEQGGGSSGQLLITAFEPPNQLPVGQLLTVIGTNFVFPPEGNNVTVDGTPITSFQPDSTSTHLRFIVPNTISAPPGGRNVTIRVSNANGSDQRLYRLLPEIPVSGNPPIILDVQPLSGGLIQVNQPIIITGQNFAATPSENIITFQITTAAGVHIYDNPQINAAQSNTTQIVVTVPDITEIAVGSTAPVTLRVGVGAHVPASRNIIVIRMP